LARFELSREGARRTLRSLAALHSLAGRTGKPRLQRLPAALAGRGLAFVVGLMGVLIALPIPLGNVLPAVALIGLGLGLLRKDGLATLVGVSSALLGLLWPAAMVAAAWSLGSDGVAQLIPG
jgi:hypothetical protein